MWNNIFSVSSVNDPLNKYFCLKNSLLTTFAAHPLHLDHCNYHSRRPFEEHHQDHLQMKASHSYSVMLPLSLTQFILGTKESLNNEDALHKQYGGQALQNI